MDMKASRELLKVSWKMLMQNALDAYLVQLETPMEIKLTEAGMPDISGLQQFLVIPLAQPVQDGYFVWGLTLPTIANGNAHQRDEVAHQREDEKGSR